MQPTQVHIGVMDSRKPGQVVSLPVRHLTMGQRVGRGLLRMVMVSLPGALFALFPPHFCGALVAVLGGPIAGLLAARAAAVDGLAGAVPVCAVPRHGRAAARVG